MLGHVPSTGRKSSGSAAPPIENSITATTLDSIELSANSSPSRQCSAPDLEQIRKDVARTRYYGLQEFSSHAKAAEEVLHQYAIQDPEVGYCQGMNFVAGVVTLQFPDLTEAQSHFDTLLSHYRGLWVPGFPLLQAGATAFEVLFQSRVPEVWQHFEAQGLTTDMFLADTWLTLLARWLPIWFLWSIYECLEADGMIGLLSITVALLQVHAETLTEAGDFASLFVLLKELAKEPQPELDTLMKTIEEIKPHAQRAWALSQTSGPKTQRCSSLVRKGNRVVFTNTGDELLHTGWHTMISVLRGRRYSQAKQWLAHLTGSSLATSDQGEHSWRLVCPRRLAALSSCPWRRK